MPKFPPIPRLSIVVPVGLDLAAFESTLISVLENRPTGCEILVAHDGKYDDPFDLCDEVEFVTAESNDLVDLVSVGAWRARGRFVHVLASGIRATCGWIDHALEKFEHHDAGLVTPVIRHGKSGKIVAAGWSDATSGLCQPLATGQMTVEPHSATRCGGGYLQASFWRREVIRSLGFAFTGRDSVEASYAYSRLIRGAGWRNVVADQCELVCDAEALPWQTTSLRRGQRLRALQGQLRDGGASSSLLCAAKALLANALHPAKYAESLGQALAPNSAGKIASLLHVDEVARCDRDESIIRLPPSSGQPSRRAA